MRPAIFAALIALAGCVSAEEQIAKDTETSKKQCAAYGFRPGTSDFARCVFMSNTQLSDHRAEQSRRLAAFGASMQAADAAAWGRRPVTTNCTRQGVFTNCTSY